MFIPNVNINSYRRQYRNANDDQLLQILCDEGREEPRFIGSQSALLGGIHDEGAHYRGYGAYVPNAHCNSENIYSPMYYNDKNTSQGNSYWFL